MARKGTKKRTNASDVRRVLRADGSSKRTGRSLSEEDLYGGGLSGNFLKGEYTHRGDIHELIQKRHKKGLSWIDENGVWRRNGHEWKVPYGVRTALTERLYFVQIAAKYPFFVTWTSPKTGKRLKKNFKGIPSAIDFIASKAQHVDSEASVVSKHGFYIPNKLMGKFPRRMGEDQKMHYWCPRCMDARRFKATGDTFFAQKKIWSEEKQRYIWKDVKLSLMECVVCRISNRDTKFRASNQPLEKRRFKQGVRRARRRR